MAKVKLKVEPNVTLNRGMILRAGDVFEADRDEEIEQLLRHGYVKEVKPPRKRKR